MWAKDRHHLIISKIAATERVSVDELMDDLQVSRETIRRDIVALEAQGKLRRVHGGAERIAHEAEPPFEDRKLVNASAKRRIGITAARLVKPGMLVAIDAGTTTLAFANAIANIPDVSVVSNSLDVVRAILAVRPKADVVLVGGRVAAHVPGTFGEVAVATIQRFIPDIGVFSPVGLDDQRGATDFHFAEAEFARALVRSAKKSVILADETKLGAVSRVEICDCRTLDVLVTDKGASAERLSALRAAGLGEIMVE